YADASEPTQAMEAYTYALKYDDTCAMYYRNRAGTNIDLKDYVAAKTDIERAQQLEPDSERLPTLWRDMYLGVGDGEALLPHAIILQDRNPEDASGHFYVAIAYALSGSSEK